MPSATTTHVLSQLAVHSTGHGIVGPFSQWEDCSVETSMLVSYELLMCQAIIVKLITSILKCQLSELMPTFCLLHLYMAIPVKNACYKANVKYT